MVVPVNNPVAFALADVANRAARPNFELAFNQLQNTIIDRLNQEIEKAQAEIKETRVDPFLQLEYKRLARLMPYVDRYQADNNDNRFRGARALDLIDELSAASTAGDQATFDAKLAEVNALAQGFTRVDGSAIGIVAPDGLYYDVATNGLAIDDYASYADDAARQTAILAAYNRIQNGLNVAEVNATTAYDFRDRVQSKLTSLQLQVEATRAAAEAEKTQELEKLRDKYADFLKAFSIAFEVNQTRSETLARNLLGPTQVDQGSIVSILT